MGAAAIGVDRAAPIVAQMPPDGRLLTLRYWEGGQGRGVDFWTSVGVLEPTTARSVPRT